jgi:hypothetical protein
MIKLEILILLIFLIGFISAACNSTQININSAPLEEMMKIRGLGGTGTIAQRVIDNRTYNSVDDLIRVSGIKNATLAKIKSQGLACAGEETEKQDNIEEETEKQDNAEEEIDLHKVKEEDLIEEETETTELPPISLNSNSALSESKDIKTEDNKEILKKNLPLYGTMVFCIVFGGLFLLRRRKNKHGFE